MTHGRWRHTTGDGRQIITWGRYAYAWVGPFTATVGDRIVIPGNAWNPESQIVQVTGIGTDWVGELSMAWAPAGEENPERQCLCGGRVQSTDATYPLSNVRIHLECALRTIVGGIGHLRDHQFWCVDKGDVDAGLGFRASALQASDWVKANGWDKAVSI